MGRAPPPTSFFEKYIQKLTKLYTVHSCEGACPQHPGGSAYGTLCCEGHGAVESSPKTRATNVRNRKIEKMTKGTPA